MLRVLLLALLIAFASAAAAAPVKARIPGGTGILLLSKTSTAERPVILIYKEPSLGRITALDAARLPALSQSISSPDGLIPAIVTSKRSGWFRIIYDDGEREGWVEGRSTYRFYGWQELLVNRQVVLLGGLRKEFYQLRSSADSNSATLETLAKGSMVISLQLDGDWIRVTTDSQTQGWLRWRDENGRLVIAFNL